MKKKSTLTTKKVKIDLKRIISNVANVPMSAIRDSTDLQSHLGIDSFTTTEILIAIEQKYKITLNSAEVFNLRTFRDIMKLAQKYLHK